MKVMISAGEASGDIHAAKLVEALHKNAANASPGISKLECFGMGGSHMAAQGVEILVDVDKNAVMGLLEVLHKYPSLRTNLNVLRTTLTEREPDILVLVDYPHFNMKLAAMAREKDIPVLFFIAPKVWASRPGRINELKKIVDHMALILPFEKKIFDEAELPNTYVGNPLLDNKPLVEASEKAPVRKGSSKRVALLPGSRKSEVSMLLPPMLETSNLLNELHDSIEFFLPVADTIKQEEIANEIEECNAKVTLIKPTDYETLRSCDAALVASGTATLELAILGIPLVVIYKLNSISYSVLKRMLTIKHVSLVNIIAGSEVVPEKLQDEVTADNLTRELQTLLTDSDARDKQMAGLASVYKQLGKDGASKLTAELIVSLAKDRTQVPIQRSAVANRSKP